MSRRWEPVTLTRNCKALTVPYGEEVELSEGGQVQIVQRLGGSITVQTEMGTLMRLRGEDADAVGLEVEASPHGHHPSDGTFDMDRVEAALDTVYDPEIPVSILELGLVYRCEEVIRDDGRRRIEIDMSMTAPGCGMGDVLREDVIRAVNVIPGVNEVDVNLVWQPPWTIARMSEAARLQLGLL
ncbi:MAG TPA: putative Fe-S cluster assembly protein SufT [Ilumatobacteraceae bacterium]|nr:putative Fe-S cluster assembly protein SufT [Ilumatobacteraceae bacterium]